MAIGHDVQGDVILVADPDLLWRRIRRRPPPQELAQATERYLAHLIDRYRYLDFKGMGVSDRVPLRMPLLDMYVSLMAEKRRYGRSIGFRSSKDAPAASPA